MGELGLARGVSKGFFSNVKKTRLISSSLESFTANSKLQAGLMKNIIQIFETFTFDDFAHCLGTGFCLVISEVAPVLAVIALFYQIRVLRAKAQREERQLKKECGEK